MSRTTLARILDTSRKRLAALAGLLAALYGIAVASYMRYDHHGLADACWWAFMTLTTVGYGDQYPTSVQGRLAGVILVMAAVFIIVPTLTAVVASRLIVDDDAWTHDEQELVKRLLTELHEALLPGENVQK